MSGSTCSDTVSTSATCASEVIKGRETLTLMQNLQGWYEGAVKVLEDQRCTVQSVDGDMISARIRTEQGQ